MYFIVIFYCN